jgi:hypothetical protein
MPAKVYPRWKEQLVWDDGETRLVFELTMGVEHVYFPTRQAWDRQVPDRVKHRYDEVLADIEAWCRKSKTPLTVEPHARVET